MGKFSDSLIGGSIDLGLGSIGSGLQTLFGIASSKYNADLQYQYNKKLADDAHQRQVDFWNMQNAYNSPAAQMSRLRQAGLNPALLNGGVQGNTAGNLSSVPTPSVGAGGSMPTSPAANLGAMVDTLSKLASAGMVNEQTKYWMEQAIGAGIENDVKRALRAQGWSEAAIAEMDRAARWKAAHPDEDLPDNPFFDSWEQSDDGVNDYIDTSENKKADTALKEEQKATEEKKQENLDANSTAISDSNKRAQELHSLNKQLLEHQISSAEYISNLQKNEAEFSDIKVQIRSDLDVDYDTLPTWLQADCLAIINCERNLRSLSAGEVGTDSWFQRNKALRELAKLKVEFEASLKRFGYISEYDYSYSNRKSEDTKSANTVNQSTWDREKPQREFDNQMKKLQVITNIANSLYSK